MGDLIARSSRDDLLKDYKTRLQELMQREYGLTPEYRMVGTSGPDHARTFEIDVFLSDRTLAKGFGRKQKRKRNRTPPVPPWKHLKRTSRHLREALHHPVFHFPTRGARTVVFTATSIASGGRRSEPLSAGSVARGIESGLASPRRRPEQRVEVAFYGGTFTALNLGRQDELLRTVAPFRNGGRVQGLRLSTRAGCPGLG